MMPLGDYGSYYGAYTGNWWEAAPIYQPTDYVGNWWDAGNYPLVNMTDIYWGPSYTGNWWQGASYPGDLTYIGSPGDYGVRQWTDSGISTWDGTYTPPLEYFDPSQYNVRHLPVAPDLPGPTKPGGQSTGPGGQSTGSSTGGGKTSGGWQDNNKPPSQQPPQTTTPRTQSPVQPLHPTQQFPVTRQPWRTAGDPRPGHYTYNGPGQYPLYPGSYVRPHTTGPGTYGSPTIIDQIKQSINHEPILWIGGAALAAAVLMGEDNRARH